MQDATDNVEEVGVYIRWTNQSFCVFDKHHYYGSSFFEKTTIIIIMSRYQHGYFRPSLATAPDCPWLPAGPQGYITYRHRAVVVIYWPSTEPSIKICTCVDKWKKKRKQVGVMKEYRQVPAAVDLVGDRKASVRASLSNPNQDAEEVLLWSGEEVGSI